MKIKISEIINNPEQPRQNFTGIDDLAESIKGKGLLEPIMVRPFNGKYQIVHGERRWRACQVAGLTEIDCIVRELSDNEAYQIAVIENLQRSDLTPIEEARSFKRLQDQGMKQGEIAKMIGKGRTYVAHKIRLLSVPSCLTWYLDHGGLSENHLRQVLKLKNLYGEARETIFKDIAEKNIKDFELAEQGDSWLSKEFAWLLESKVRMEGRKQYHRWELEQGEDREAWILIAHLILNQAASEEWTVKEISTEVDDIFKYIDLCDNACIAYPLILWGSGLINGNDNHQEKDAILKVVNDYFPSFLQDAFWNIEKRNSLEHKQITDFFAKRFTEQRKECTKVDCSYKSKMCVSKHTS